MSTSSESERKAGAAHWAPRGGQAQSGAGTGGYHTHARPEMLPFVPAGAQRILDVGCGAGAFAAALKRERRGAEVWGVEPDKQAHAKASQALDHALCGLFDDTLALPEAYFDAIVFNDSLEHFADHRPALRLARRLLAPAGVVVASVPNVRYWPHLKHYLFEADWRYESEGIRDHTHLRFFTRRSLVRALQEAGYELMTVKGINPCWSDWRRRLAPWVLPRGMQDMLYLQFAVTARAGAPSAPADGAPRQHETHHGGLQP